MRLILFCLLSLLAFAEGLDPLTDPGLSFAERMKWAREAPVDFSLLPRLLEARAVLRHEEELHHWGYSAYPLDARLFFPATQWLGKTRTILGHDWTVPGRATRLQDESQAPWPYQAGKALEVYLGRMAPHDAVAAERWLKLCLGLPRRNDQECLTFLDLCQMSSHWKNPEVLAVHRSIALNPATPQAAQRAAMNLANSCRLWNDPRSMELGRRYTLELLRSAPAEKTRRQAAYGLKDLRENWDLNLGRSVRQPEPTACILEALRCSQDPSHGSQWDRLYAYGFSACEAMDHSPIPVDRRMDPQSPLVTQRLRELGEWLRRR